MPQLAAITFKVAAWSVFTHIGRASLQGGALIAVVWLVCRLIPKLPAHARQALWLLACLKLIVTLFWAAPIAVPVLRPTPLPPILAALPTRSHFVTPQITPSPEIFGPPVQFRETQLRPASAELALAKHSAPITPATALFAAYLLATLASLIAIAVRAGRMHRIVRQAVPIGEGLLTTLVADCATKAGLLRVPTIRVSNGITGPLVCGLVSPTILLPARFLPGREEPGYRSKEYPYGADCGDDVYEAARNVTSSRPLVLEESASFRGELEKPENVDSDLDVCIAGLQLALAHEMAHIKRGDLWMSIIPTVARLLFWFHPLAYLAQSEFRAATEEACDARTIRITGARPGDYFRVLLAVAENSSRGAGQSGAPALGLSSTFTQLKRRLDNLAVVCGRPVSIEPACGSRSPYGGMCPRHGAVSVHRACPSFNSVRATGLWPDKTISTSPVTAALPMHCTTAPWSVSFFRAVTRGPGHALLWKRRFAVTPIDPLPAYRQSDASGINDNGTVIASAYNYGSYHHAYVWSGGSQDARFAARLSDSAHHARSIVPVM